MIGSYLVLLSALAFSPEGDPAAVAKKIPDDPYFTRQVSFEHAGGQARFDQASYAESPIEFALTDSIHLNVTRAWSITTGSSDVVVALLDDGFFYSHEDLQGNIWSNPGETGVDEKGYPRETNGKDDDGNGYVDDVSGWDFVFDDPDPDCYVFDGRDATKVQPYRHSISALGIIGAVGDNGVGVAGINWEVSMMLLKTAAQGNTGTEERVERTALAVRYAVDNGARIINWSGFVQTTDPVELEPLQQAFDYAEKQNVLIVIGAGNEAANMDLDENCFFPGCAQNENVVSVAEVDFDGSLYVVPDDSKYIGGSNFGPRNVDIAAFAQNFTTDLRHGRSTYSLGGGTSNAAPVVSGVAALVLSVRPELGARELKRILMESARRLPALKDKVASGGMVDAYAAVTLALDGGRD